MHIDSAEARVYAGWFKCLSDPTRLIILNRLATAEEPMSVGRLVAEVEVGQPTVSHHLRKLAEVGFVVVERVANTALYRINHHCLKAFPSAAELVMGNAPAFDPVTCLPPWLRETEDHPPGRGTEGTPA